MRQQPRSGRLFRIVGAVLALDLVLAVVAVALFLRPGGSGAPADEGGAAVPALSLPSPVGLTVEPTGVATGVGAAPPTGAPSRAASAPPSVAGSVAPSVAPSAVPASAAAAGRAGGLAPNPIVGVGKPVFASAGGAAASAVADGRYCGQSVWRAAAFPAWVAIQVGAGPQRLLLSWNGADPDDFTADDSAGPGVPIAYTIETSADSTNGADGTWKGVARVADNAARTRAHSFAFAGASWVRMTIAAGGDGAVALDEIDLHDVSAGSADSVFFLGDSITAASFLRCERLQPSFAALVHETYTSYMPAMIDGGVSGVSSDYGVARIDRLLAENPDYAVWAIAYGTNDAYRERPSPVFEEQLQTLIDRVRAAGKEPVLATIPYTANAAKDIHVRRLNGIIAQLTARNNLRPGPDLYTWFKEHPQELGADGIHPTNVGALSINRLWFEALRGRYER